MAQVSSSQGSRSEQRDSLNLVVPRCASCRTTLNHSRQFENSRLKRTSPIYLPMRVPCCGRGKIKASTESAGN